MFSPHDKKCRPQYIQYILWGYRQYCGYILWTTIYILYGCRPCVNPVEDISTVGDILWVSFYILWTYTVDNMLPYFIRWIVYPVDDSRPQDIWVVVHGTYILWVYAVGALEFY